MRRYFTIFLLGLAGFALTVNLSCEADYFVPEDVQMPDTVKLSIDIQPIFDASCNTTGCHSQGGYVPNLTEGSSHMNLTAYGMVDTTDPELSIVYKRLTSTTNPMPPEGNLPAGKIDLILKWIEQGALNN